MKRIMFFDDDGSAGRLADSLRQARYEVITAADKFEVFSTIRQGLDKGEAFDLLVLSVEMPAADGLELIDRLRAAGIAISCLALISFLDETLLGELLKRRCMDYMEKPVSPEDLLDRVGHMLDKEVVKRQLHKASSS